MGRSQESFNKKEVRNKKEKKRKEKEKKRLAKKSADKSGSLDDLIAYVDENGVITSTPPDPAQKEEANLEEIEISVPRQEDREEIDPVRTGIVSFFNDSKGFGFIRDLETQASVFVHVNNIIDDIKEGNTVNFEVEKGLKGPSAIKVTLKK
ncbi:MAG TPA: cold shock domain-containing protein [Bacteroidales bacterium]|nr:cold shock domain-containing protein [Bacteroidales bacterium]